MRITKAIELALSSLAVALSADDFNECEILRVFSSILDHGIMLFKACANF